MKLIDKEETITFIIKYDLNIKDRIIATLKQLDKLMGKRG